VQEIHERVRVDQVSVAIGYLELAIDALELAARNRCEETLMPCYLLPATCYLVVWSREATLQVDPEDRSMSPAHLRPDP